MNSTVAVLQMCSRDDLPVNLAVAEKLLSQAAALGATLAVLPENFAYMGAHESGKLAHAENPGSGPIQDFLAQMSKKLSLWIVAGTIPLKPAQRADKVYAACLVYGAAGACMVRYDKIHLFDVQVQREGKTETYRESATIEAGAPQLITQATPAGVLGLSVCYDLRFAELYRGLTKLGAQLLCVPSAFTERTGEAHWLPLLQARAIENQCFVLAPNQSGIHPGGRRTWGHSMIIDAWGQVLAQQDQGEGVVLASLDHAKLSQIRSSFPSLTHRRLP